MSRNAIQVDTVPQYTALCSCAVHETENPEDDDAPQQDALMREKSMCMSCMYRISSSPELQLVSRRWVS